MEVNIKNTTAWLLSCNAGYTKPLTGKKLIKRISPRSKPVKRTILYTSISECCLKNHIKHISSECIRCSIRTGII